MVLEIVLPTAPARSLGGSTLELEGKAGSMPVPVRQPSEDPPLATAFVLAVITGAFIWGYFVASEPTTEISQNGRPLQGTFVYSQQRDEVLFQPEGWQVPYLPLPGEYQEYLDHPITVETKPHTLVPSPPP